MFFAHFWKTAWWAIWIINFHWVLQSRFLPAVQKNPLHKLHTDMLNCCVQFFALNQPAITAYQADMALLQSCLLNGKISDYEQMASKNQMVIGRPGDFEKYFGSKGFSTSSWFEILKTNCPLANPDKAISFALTEERTEDKPNNRTPVRTRQELQWLIF